MSKEQERQFAHLKQVHTANGSAQAAWAILSGPDPVTGGSHVRLVVGEIDAGRWEYASDPGLAALKYTERKIYDRIGRLECGTCAKPLLEHELIEHGVACDACMSRGRRERMI